MLESVPPKAGRSSVRTRLTPQVNKHPHPYFLDLLLSLTSNKLYIDKTKYHIKRSEKHNKGYSKSSKSGILILYLLPSKF